MWVVWQGSTLTALLQIHTPLEQLLLLVELEAQAVTEEMVVLERPVREARVLQEQLVELEGLPLVEASSGTMCSVQFKMCTVQEMSLSLRVTEVSPGMEEAVVLEELTLLVVLVLLLELEVLQVLQPPEALLDKVLV
jgi:hypothetical protein